MTAAIRSGQGSWAAAGMVLAVLGRLSAEVPAIVEWHKTMFFPRVAAILQWMSGAAPTTIGEVGAVLAVALGLVALGSKGRRVVPILTFTAGAAIMSFYGLWGLAYRYPSLGSRLSPATTWAEAPFAQAVEKSARLVERAARPSATLAGSQAELLARINAGLLVGFRHLPGTIEASPVHALVFSPVKPSRFSFALSRLQLSGYFFPWSGEAQINMEMPRSLWPRVAAHEKAHQRGFARENEATVIGVLACLSSSDPTVIYSGALGLFVAFDRELALVDPEGRRRIWTTLPPQAVLDLGREAAFWKVHEGVAGALSERANDTFLKAQGVRSGVGSYSETAGLFLQAIEAGLVGFGLDGSGR